MTFSGVCRKVTALLVVTSIGFYACLQNESFIEQIDVFLTNIQDYEEHIKKNIYLHNNYAPVADEHRAVPAVKCVEGSIPDNLRGVFIRNGPNPIPQHEWKKGHHWFDGHGQLHTVRLQGNIKDVLYSNQYIPTPRYQIEKEKGYEYFLRIGEIKGFLGIIKAALLEPRRLKFQNVDSLTVGQANTHIILSKEHKFYALHEASLPFEVELNEDGSMNVDPNNSALGFESFGGVLDYAVSAHPKVDPVSGNFLFHSYSPDPNKVSESGNFKVGEYNIATRQVESYYGIRNEDGHTSFAHDMMFTANHFVLYDSSVHFDPVATVKYGTFFSWKPEHNLRFGLAPRHQANATGDDVMWFDVGSPQVIVHPLNAWEEDDGTVVLWSPTGDYFDISIEKGNNVFYMVEYRMNPNTGEVTKTVIDKEWNIEFSRIRPDFIGQFGRFGTATIMEPKLGGDALGKGFIIYDMLEKKMHKTVLYREGDVGGEAVVIPKPGTVESHEFYVVTMIQNMKEEKSYFVLYDGETGELTARVELPHRVPSGFHGEWLSEEQLRGHLDYHASLKKQQTMMTATE